MAQATFHSGKKHFIHVGKFFVQSFLPNLIYMNEASSQSGSYFTTCVFAEPIVCGVEKLEFLANPN